MRVFFFNNSKLLSIYINYLFACTKKPFNVHSLKQVTPLAFSLRVHNTLRIFLIHNKFCSCMIREWTPTII